MRGARRMGGKRGLRGGSGKSVDGAFPERPFRTFGIKADQWPTAALDEGEWRRTAEQGAARFIAKWIAAEKARAGLWHAVVCPNVTRRTKEMIAQSKRARAGSLAIMTSHKRRELASSECLVCRCHIIFLWCHVFCFVLFRFRILLSLRSRGPSSNRSSFFDMHAPPQPHAIIPVHAGCAPGGTYVSSTTDRK